MIKGSLEVLTSDYTESCSIDVFTAEMFWRVGIARNAVFFRSFVAGGSGAQDVDKICTTPARESDLE